jgi:cyclophilin family peptidyl-prolyl cis-trans isomerase
MKKTYILALVLFVGIAGGSFFWKSQPKVDRPLAEAPTLIQQSMTKTYTSPPAMSIDQNKTYTASIVTDKGTMVVTLFAKDAPATVNNFVVLAREGFYTNTIFHRVMKEFMIQGGDPKGNGTGGPGYTFADEPVTRDYIRGTVAMANSGPNTNGSQFFIMHATYSLPKQYVIFGAIDPSDSTSLATLDAIATAPVIDNGMGETSKPITPTVLQSVSIREE